MSLNKADLIIDLIKGEHFGAKLPKKDVTPSGRIKFHYRPLNKIMGDKIIQYPLKENKDIIRINPPNPKIGEINLLVPMSDIPHINRNQTIWSAINQKLQNRIKELEERNSDLVSELKAVKKQLRVYKDEEAEKEKKESSGTTKNLKCTNCGDEWTMKEWKDNDAECKTCGNDEAKRT